MVATPVRGYLVVVAVLVALFGVHPGRAEVVFVKDSADYVIQHGGYGADYGHATCLDAAAGTVFIVGYIASDVLAVGTWDGCAADPCPTGSGSDAVVYALDPNDGTTKWASRVAGTTGMQQTAIGCHVRGDDVYIVVKTVGEAVTTETGSATPIGGSDIAIARLALSDGAVNNVTMFGTASRESPSRMVGIEDTLYVAFDGTGALAPGDHNGGEDFGVAKFIIDPTGAVSMSTVHQYCGVGNECAVGSLATRLLLNSKDQLLVPVVHYQAPGATQTSRFNALVTLDTDLVFLDAYVLPADATLERRDLGDPAWAQDLGQFLVPVGSKSADEATAKCELQVFDVDANGVLSLADSIVVFDKESDESYVGCIAVEYHEGTGVATVFGHWTGAIRRVDLASKQVTDTVYVHPDAWAAVSTTVAVQRLPGDAGFVLAGTTTGDAAADNPGMYPGSAASGWPWNSAHDLTVVKIGLKNTSLPWWLYVLGGVLAAVLAATLFLVIRPQQRVAPKGSLPGPSYGTKGKASTLDSMPSAADNDLEFMMPSGAGANQSFIPIMDGPAPAGNGPPPGMMDEQPYRAQGAGSQRKGSRKGSVRKGSQRKGSAHRPPRSRSRSHDRARRGRGGSSHRMPVQNHY